MAVSIPEGLYCSICSCFFYGAADDLKAAFALYSFACPLMLTATSIYYLHR